MRDEVRVVLVTAPEAEALAMARNVVESGVAACVNVVPGVRSVYRWQGEVVEDGEHLLIMKTTTSSVDALRRAVTEQHSYDVPEFLELPVTGGSPDYLNWLQGQVGVEG